MHQSMQAFRATGAERQARPYILALLAEAYETMGQPAEGLRTLTEALTLVDKTGERWYEPELYRLKGALLLQQSSDNSTEAETCFHHALRHRSQPTSEVLGTSCRHQPRSSLAPARQTPGSPRPPCTRLRVVHGRVRYLDLKDAKVLLDELAWHRSHLALRTSTANTASREG